MEAMYVRPIESLDVETDMPNIGTRWKKWINRFENYLEAVNICEDKEESNAPPLNR